MKKKIFNFIILVVITGIVLYMSLKDDYYTIINTIFHMNLIYILIVVIFYILYLFFKSIIFYKIAKKFNSEYDLKKSFRTCLETNFFHAITPFSTGGQPYEIYRLNKDGLSTIDSANVSIQCFIVYQIVLVLLGIIAILYNHFTGLFVENNLLKNLVLLGFTINFLVIVFLFFITYAKKSKKVVLKIIIKLLSKIRIIKDEEKILEKLNQYLNDFDKGAKILMEDKKNFLFLLLIQLISLVSYYITPLFVFLAAGVNSIHIIEAIITSAYVMIIGSFVPIPGGTGGIEYGFISFYGNFLKGNILNAIMLVWRILTYYLGMIVGMILLGFRKKD